MPNPDLTGLKREIEDALILMRSVETTRAVGGLAGMYEWSTNPDGAAVVPVLESALSTIESQAEQLAEAREALAEIVKLPELSRGAMADDFDRGARAARLDAADIARAASPVGEGEQDHEGIFSPFNACCYRETCRAMVRPTPATLATCQACGGPIEGWICQSCDREFREDDTGNLVFDEDTPATPEGLREKVMQAVLLGGDAWAITDAILSALQPQAQGGE